MTLITPAAASHTLFVKDGRASTSRLPGILSAVRRFIAAQVLQFSYALHENRRRQAQRVIERYRHLVDSESQTQHRSAGKSKSGNSRGA